MKLLQIIAKSAQKESSTNPNHHGIWSSGNNLMATDTRRLAVMPTEMPEGFYNPDTMQKIETTGKCIDYDRVIPKNSTMLVYLNTKQVGTALEMLKAIAKKGANIATFDFTQEGKCFLQAKSREPIAFASVEIAVEDYVKAEEKGTISFNIVMLLDFVKSMQSPRFLMGTTTPTYPGLFRADGITYVQMPMTV